MPHTPRAEQIEQDRLPGVHRKTLAGTETGARMLMVGDLIFDPGAGTPYHRHPNAEETQFMVYGELECMLDGRLYTVGRHDTVLAAEGVPHGFVNRSDKPARMITIFPHTAPLTLYLDTSPDEQGAELPPAIVRRDAPERVEAYPGVGRYDVIGGPQGAASTTLRVLFFDPETSTTIHFHPETEESMLCVEGRLRAVYGREEFDLLAGDMLTAEPGVRHGVSNPFAEKAMLLAIHPTLDPEVITVE